MTYKDRIFHVLKDGEWHTFRELLDVYYKYTQRIFDLRQEGYEIEERPNLKNKHACDYRLKVAECRGGGRNSLVEVGMAQSGRDETVPTRTALSPTIQPPAFNQGTLF